jgi:hypothetical protein
MSLPEIAPALAALVQFMAAHGFNAAARADVAACLAAGPVAASGAVPWPQFRTELLEQYGPKLRAKATLRSILHAVNVLEELGVKSTADLDCRLLTRLVTSRPETLSPNSLKGLLRRVQSICSHAHNFGYLPVSPFTVRPIRTWVRGTKPRGVKHLTRVQVRAILDLLTKDVAERKG